MSRPKPKLRRKVHPQAVHRYLTLEFREELRRKAREYLIGADMVRRTDGTRFPKEITQDPLYVAIGYLRRRVYAHAQRQADLPPYDPAHAGVICRYILEAVSLDDFAAISDLAKLLEIQARGGARSKPKDTCQASNRCAMKRSGNVCWKNCCCRLSGQLKAPWSASLD